MPFNFFKTLFENISEKDISKIFSDIFKTPREVKLNIEDFQNIFSQKIDEIILDRESKTGEEYIGGNFSLTYLDEKNYLCAFGLYFENKEEKINSVSAESDMLDISKLTQKAILELKPEGTIKFEIPEPDESVRKKYKLVKQ